MSTVNGNAALFRAIQKVLGKQSATSVSLSLKVTSPSNPSWAWEVMFIDRMMVIQDFLGMYGDDITCDVKISPAQALRLHENMGDLEASLTLTYMGQSRRIKALEVEPLTLKFRVMVVGARDLRRSIQGAKGRVEDTMDLTLRFIDPLLYDVRQRQFYTTFTNTTVGNAIRYIASAFGVKSLNMAPPDNTHVYDHIIIPPAKGFDEIWSYIQDTYGVYMKGICSYITNGTLYIYPPYEHRSNERIRAHFYLDDKGGHAGLPSYHSVSDDVLEVVLDGDADVIDLSQMGGENIGTGLMFSRSNQILDGYTKTDDSGTELTHSSAMMIGVDSAKTAGADRHNVRQAHATTDNVFALSSQLMRYQAEIVQADWRMAVLWKLSPGQPVRYIYDDEGTLASTDGILDAIGYELINDGPIGGGKSSFSAMGRVRLRIDPDHT